ncbi:MAG: hypothetical protein KDA99_23615, partial [Planctomycetales bacterium]|nr:hypothetical protein [Planctomycetales bacterium]
MGASDPAFYPQKNSVPSGMSDMDDPPQALGPRRPVFLSVSNHARGRCVRCLSAAAVFVVVLSSGVMHAYAQSADAAPPPEAIDFFETKIRPVLSAHCYDCHSGESDPIEGGLLLDSREGTLRGGNGGSVVTHGDPAHSRLLTAIRHQDDDL